MDTVLQWESYDGVRSARIRVFDADDDRRPRTVVVDERHASGPRVAEEARFVAEQAGRRLRFDPTEATFVFRFTAASFVPGASDDGRSLLLRATFRRSESGGLGPPAWRVISPAALAVARANIERHGVAARVRLIEADLFPPGAARYRVIMSNPPYVPTAEVAALPPEYRHEPRSGLDGGADGLDPARRILAGAGARLAPDGVLIVEVGESAAALEAAYPRVPWTWIEFERGGDGVFLLAADDLKHGWR